MRSAIPIGGAADDRSTKARIRDAAIECIARHGLGDTTVRKVAEEAAVSPGLVIHHFETMDGLRRACDLHVAAAIRSRKRQAMAEGPQLDILSAIRDADLGNLSAYLARVLVDDSDLVNRLVDEMISDAEGYIQQGVDSGMLRPSDDPRGRAAILTLWTLGGLVLHHHMERAFGIDLTDPASTTHPEFVRYVRSAMEVVGSGMFTDEFNQQITAALNAPSDDHPEGPR